MTSLQQAAARILAGVDLHDEAQDPTATAIPVETHLLADLQEAYRADMAATIHLLNACSAIGMMKAQADDAQRSLDAFRYRQGDPLPATGQLKDNR